MANLFDTLKNGATTVVKNLNGPGSGANNLG